MRKLIAIIALCVLVALPIRAQEKENERLEECATVLKEIINIPDNIPQSLLDKAECVLVVPSVKKGAFIVGASYGRGAISCRTGKNWEGPWSPPAMYRLYQGSIGLQIGGQATDFVLLVMNSSGARSILNSKVKLGGDASVAAGPKGRSAEAATNESMKAEVLTYSRSQGVFAGISLSGANLQSDNDDNRRLYGKKLSATEIVLEGKAQATSSGQALMKVLNEKSPKNLSESKSN